MHAKDIMVTEVITASGHEVLADLIARIRETHVRMFPVINDQNIVLGAVSTFSIMEHMLPSYILSAGLGDLAFAPDIDVLRTRYQEAHNLSVSELMESTPLLVYEDEAVFTVAAALMRYGKHECAIVVDKEHHLLGLISAEDILNSLSHVVEASRAS